MNTLLSPSTINSFTSKRPEGDNNVRKKPLKNQNPKTHQVCSDIIILCVWTNKDEKFNPSSPGATFRLSERRDGVEQSWNESSLSLYFLTGLPKVPSSIKRHTDHVKGSTNLYLNPVNSAKIR